MTSETTTKPQNTPETTLQPGQLVAGKYRVDRLLGKGGMAEVWAGTNERTGKRIALKAILRSFASSSDAVELFRREALAGSRVNHPNVVNVFDVIDHDGMTCIVMEMLEGEPFGTYLRRKGKLSVEEAITLLLPAMRGVAAANAEGVVHRDLKPQNIYICIGPDGRLVTTKVLDFGIAVMREKSVDGAEVTQLLATHGTPAYMSPEHISGALDIDERADVYGFGVLFFEALTGQVPFSGDAGPALLVRILNEAAPKITGLQPDLPPAIVEIIERAMAKDPRDRFRTIDDFIRAVEDCFLPSSPLPRSLTPMAGVPLFALSEQKSGSMVDSVVPFRGEGSGLNEISHTQALFTLPREGSDAHPTPLARNRPVEGPGPATAEMASDLSLGGRLKKVFLRRGVAPVTFVGVVLIVGYFAFPRAHRAPAEPAPAPVESRAAAVAPPTVPAPEPLPAVPAVTAPAATAVAAEPEPEPKPSEPAPIAAPVAVVGESAPSPAPGSAEEVASRPTKSSRAVRHAGTRTVAAEAQHASGRPAPVTTPSPSPRAPAGGPAPRAGTLSSDDF
jgi:serine/threonine protein kinase